MFANPQKLAVGGGREFSENQKHNQPVSTKKEDRNVTSHPEWQNQAKPPGGLDVDSKSASRASGTAAAKGLPSGAKANLPDWFNNNTKGSAATGASKARSGGTSPTASS